MYPIVFELHSNVQFQHCRDHHLAATFQSLRCSGERAHIDVQEVQSLRQIRTFDRSRPHAFWRTLLLNTLPSRPEPSRGRTPGPLQEQTPQHTLAWSFPVAEQKLARGEAPRPTSGSRSLALRADHLREDVGLVAEPRLHTDRGNSSTRELPTDHVTLHRVLNKTMHCDF